MTTETLSARATAAARATYVRAALALGFAAATALAAQVRVPLPFTPVPITGQTATVLLAGAFLGGGWGAASMGIYLLAGALGGPVFAGATGVAALLGPTGGYLLAFMFVPVLVGRALPPTAGLVRAFLVLLAASGVILLWGMLQLALVLDIPAERAFRLGMAPFLIGDVVKVTAAACVFRAARPFTSRLRR
jgi:biotin transport system substrate-specific component